MKSDAYPMHCETTIIWLLPQLTGLHLYSVCGLLVTVIKRMRSHPVTTTGKAEN
jgi:hypothetical protein